MVTLGPRGPRLHTNRFEARGRLILRLSNLHVRYVDMSTSCTNLEKPLLGNADGSTGIF